MRPEAPALSAAGRRKRLEDLVLGHPAYAGAQASMPWWPGHELVAVSLSQPGPPPGREAPAFSSISLSTARALGARPAGCFHPSDPQGGRGCRFKLDCPLAPISPVVVGLRQISPPAVSFTSRPWAAGNGHGSLRAAWRGAAPDQWKPAGRRRRKQALASWHGRGLRHRAPCLLEKAGADRPARERPGNCNFRLRQSHRRAAGCGMPLSRGTAGPGSQRWRGLSAPQPAPTSAMPPAGPRKDFRITWSAGSLTLHRQGIGAVSRSAPAIWGEKRLKLAGQPKPLVARAGGPTTAARRPAAQAWNKTGLQLAPD